MTVNVRVGSSWVPVGSSTATGKTKVARIYESKSQNTAGGTPSGTGFENRTLNAKDDPYSFVTLESGNIAFSLAAGTYRINWRAPAHDGGAMRTKLEYANNSSFTSSSEVLGETGASDTANSESNYYSCGNAILTTTEKIYFRIQQAQALGNWGQASNLGGPEIYTQVFVEDLATAIKESNVVNTGKTKVATVKDVKAATANGGEFTALKWIVRTLNTITDPHNIGLTVSTNIVTFPAGTYSIKWTAPAYNVREHNTVLIYSPVQPETATSDTASTTKVQGSAEWTGYSNTAGLDYPQTCSKGVIASVTFTQTNYIRLEHYVRTAMDTYGLGVATWGGAIPADIFGDSVYAQIEIEDLSTAIKDAAPAPADVPIGGIIMWSGTKTALDALTNWVMCDDSAAAVAAGAPDLRDKFIIGAHSFSDEGDGKWETNVTGSGTQSGGHKNAVLLAHEHKAPTWNGVSSGGFESGWTTGGYDYGTQAPPTEKTAIDADGNITTGDSATQTGDNANLPPYWALAYIMKIS